MGRNSVVAVAVPALVVALLLVPRHVDLPIMWLSAPWLLGDAARSGTPLWWALEDLANVALFLPVGFALARWTGPLPAVLLGGSLSAACEYAQQAIPHRHASPLDVAMNASGALLGAVLAVVVARRTAWSDQPHLAAAGALPERHAARRGRGGLHPVQAGGAVGHVQVGVVERERRGRDVETVPVVLPVVAHVTMLMHGSDVAPLDLRTAP